MESTLDKKISTTFFKSILGYFLFVTFFQSYYFIVLTQKVATHCKEQNKKRIMPIGLKTKKLFKVKKCPKNSKFLV